MARRSCFTVYWTHAMQWQLPLHAVQHGRSLVLLLSCAQLGGDSYFPSRGGGKCACSRFRDRSRSQMALTA
eukprot:6174302-Pleurochrysis_carterae.AAC.3